MLFFLRWPFSAWPPVPWLISSSWGFIFSGFLPTALAADNVLLRKSYLSSTFMMQEFLFHTRANWSPSLEHFNYPFCYLAPGLPKFSKCKFFCNSTEVGWQRFGTTLIQQIRENGWLTADTSHPLYHYEKSLWERGTCECGRTMILFLAITKDNHTLQSGNETLQKELESKMESKRLSGILIIWWPHKDVF